MHTETTARQNVTAMPEAYLLSHLLLQQFSDATASTGRHPAVQLLDKSYRLHQLTESEFDRDATVSPSSTSSIADSARSWAPPAQYQHQMQHDDEAVVKYEQLSNVALATRVWKQSASRVTVPASKTSAADDNLDGKTRRQKTNASEFIKDVNHELGGFVSDDHRKRNAAAVALATVKSNGSRSSFSFDVTNTSFSSDVTQIAVNQQAVLVVNLSSSNTAALTPSVFITSSTASQSSTSTHNDLLPPFVRVTGRTDVLNTDDGKLY